MARKHRALVPRGQNATEWLTAISGKVADKRMGCTFHYKEAMKECSKMMRGVAVAEKPAREGDASFRNYEIPVGALAGMLGQVTSPEARTKYHTSVDPRNLGRFVTTTIIIGP